MSDERSLEQWLLIKRGLYYRKYSQGYTSVKDEAQMYSHEEALKRCMAIIQDASLAHPGDHETVYAIPDRLAPAYVQGGFSDVIARHASTTVASLAAERDAAIARAEAAEAQVERLREALRRCLIFIEDAESKWGCQLGCGDVARAALASKEPADG